MLNAKNLDKFVSDALEIESEAAQQAGTLGYMARALVQATMPHKNPGLVNVWGRRNGNFSMVIQPGYTLDKNGKSRNTGLPYGSKPRLVLAYISSEAVKTRSRDIILGRSLSSFMHQLDLVPTGGRWGTIPMLREQMRRLFSATVAFQYDGKTEEITERPVPLDTRALSALKGSSLALDIYCWLTYRMSYLRKPIEIPWTLLAAQFGSDYTELRDFKKNFLKQLRKVDVIYNTNIQQGQKGLLIKPGKTHILSSRQA